jgi:AraC-like DNA-binding protein
MILTNILNFNFFNVIILLGIIHGIVFSLILLFSPKLKSKTNFFLAFTIFALCFSNLQYWLLDVGLAPGYKNNTLIFIPFEFLMLPMFFLFVKSYLRKTISTYYLFLLLMPFAFTTLYLIYNHFINIEPKLFKVLNLLIEYFSIIFSVGIIILVFKEILKYEKIAKINSTKITKTVRWLKRTLIFAFFLCLLWIITLKFFSPYFPDGYYMYYPLWIGISLLIYWIAYTSIFQSIIYKEREEIRIKISQQQSKIIEVNKQSKTINPKKFNEINSYIINNKLFLKPRLSLKIISDYTKLSEGYLSQLINTNSSMNFNDYINSFRVENVKKLLLDKEYSNYTITAIGLESGFTTKSSFYAAFKKNTGLTPNKFKKLVQNL